MKFSQERLCHSDFHLMDYQVMVMSFERFWSFLILYTFDLTVQKYCLPALLTEVN